MISEMMTWTITGESLPSQPTPSCALVRAFFRARRVHGHLSTPRLTVLDLIDENIMCICQV